MRRTVRNYLTAETACPMVKWPWQKKSGNLDSSGHHEPSQSRGLRHRIMLETQTPGSGKVTATGTFGASRIEHGNPSYFERRRNDFCLGNDRSAGPLTARREGELWNRDCKLGPGNSFPAAVGGGYAPTGAGFRCGPMLP